MNQNLDIEDYFDKPLLFKELFILFQLEMDEIEKVTKIKFNFDSNYELIFEGDDLIVPFYFHNNFNEGYFEYLIYVVAVKLNENLSSFF